MIGTDLATEVQLVRRLLSRERLSIDEPSEERTCFLSHLGAQTKLTPGPWIGHRDLLHALALANLSPRQRISLARAVLVNHDREFGVGRLRCTALGSGLPFGGSSLVLQPRSGGPKCLYTWALGHRPARTRCDWLLLRGQPGWAMDEPSPRLRPESLEVMAALGGEVLVLVAGAVGARQVADACAGKVSLAAHPRFAPHLEGLQPEAPVLLWPHDALDGAGLRQRTLMAVVCVDMPEHVFQAVEGWLQARGDARVPELTRVTCPGRIDRPGLRRTWEDCGRPRILLRGDPVWAQAGEQWLRQLGAEVQREGQATQLGLF